MLDLRFTPIETWPFEPTKGRKCATFRASYSQTLDLLKSELAHLRAKEITIQAFFRVNQLRNDGWPLSKATPSQPGLILSFRSPQGAFQFPCDRYQTFDDNLRGIALSLQALRAVDRYGVTKRNEQYTGWKRLEAPAAGAPKFNSRKDAAEFIAEHTGVKVYPEFILSDPAYRQTCYRAAARRLHPDAQGGNQELFIELQTANARLEKTE